MTVTPADTLRIDKWLWYARFFRSRALATKLCAAGKLRRNRQIVRKAHQTLKVGDVLTFPLGHHIRVIEVTALATRRGPAVEARTLYTDLDPPVARPATPAAPRAPARPRGSGRPTKADRRAFDKLSGTDKR